MDSSPVAWHVESALEEEDEEGDEAITKKLDFDCVETPFKPEICRASKKHSVLVFLRIRPKNQREIMSIDASCLHLVNQRELQAVAPVSSQTFKNKAGVRCPAESSQLFSFTRVFDEKAAQLDVFEEAMMPTLRDFFGGQNCLVFTYGVTNSGKTYTVTGTPTEPGILPRSLDLIFNSIAPHQLSTLQLKPKNFSEATYLTEEEVSRELARKNFLLSKARELSAGGEVQGMEETTVDTTTDNGDVSKISSNYSKISESGTTSLCEILVQDGSTIDLGDSGGSVCYSLWVSFAEIYNELIYDLLDCSEFSGGGGGGKTASRQSRPVLKLAEDRNHNHFIKGLVEVKVSSVEEALQLLQMGLRQRHVASTRLNYQSSRSHTVFTVKMMKMSSCLERPRSAFVNRISIVDLAGAERSKETGARGMRVREAGNINNSLLTLGKCIEAMRHNQNRRRGDEHIVPFRDSKLTRLFQNYFVGKGKGVARQGKITMMVNVSNSASVFDETAHVLKFSALTSKVVPIVRAVPTRRVTRQHPPPPPSSARRTGTAAKTTQKHNGLPPPPPTPATPLPGGRSVADEVDECKTVRGKMTVSVTVCEQCKEVSEECVEMRGRIHSLEVEKMECEYRIRQEVCRELQDQITEIEEAHREELEEQAEEMEVMYHKKMQLLQKSIKKQYNCKRRRVEVEDDEEEEGEGASGGRDDSRLREKVVRLEEELQNERERCTALSSEMKDAMETHESVVTHLNRQTNSISVKLSEAEDRERRLGEEITRVTSQHAREIEERERGLVSTCEELRRQLDEASERFNRVEGERDGLVEEERLSLVSEYEASERRLREEIADLKADLLTKADAVSGLAARLEGLQRETEAAGRELEERARRAEAGREDAVAEVEILQARISELTREVGEAGRRLVEREEVAGLGGRVLELEGQLAGQELAMASLRAAREAREEEAEIELSSLREKVRELEEQLTERDSAVSSLQASVEANSETTQQEVTRLQEKNRELEAVLLEREAAIASLQAASDARSETTEAKILSLQKRVSELEGQLAGRDAALASLRASNTATMSEVRVRALSLLQELASQREGLGHVHRELAEASQIHGRQMKTLASCVAGERETLRSEVSSLLSRLSARGEEVQALESRLEQESESHAARLAGWTRDLEEAVRARDGLVQRVACLETQLASSEEEKVQRVACLETQLASSEEEKAKRVACLESQLASSEEEKAERVACLESQLASSEEKKAERVACLESQLASSEEKKAERVTCLESQLASSEEKKAERVACLESQLASSEEEKAERVACLETQLASSEEKRCCLAARALTLAAKVEEGRLALVERETELTVSRDTCEALRARLTEERVTAPSDVQQDLDQGREEAEECDMKPVVDVFPTTETEALETDGSQPSGRESGVGIPRSDSKPFVAVLERSSQLVEDTFSEEPPRMIIDATPPAARRGRGRWGKKKKQEEEEVKRKREGEVKRKREEEPTTDMEPKKGKYSLRNRKKHKRFGEPQEPENHPPVSILSSVKKRKVLGSSQSSLPPASPPIPRLRTKAVRKSQISGPLSLANSTTGPPIPRSYGALVIGPRAPPLYFDHQ